MQWRAQNSKNMFQPNFRQSLKNEKRPLTQLPLDSLEFTEKLHFWQELLFGRKTPKSVFIEQATPTPKTHTASVATAPVLSIKNDNFDRNH